MLQTVPRPPSTFETPRLLGKMEMPVLELSSQVENDARDEPSRRYLPISVLIPLPFARKKGLIRLLDSIEKGSYLPKEIIIAVSEAPKAANITLLPHIPRSMNIAFQLNPGRKTAAENRNIAAQASSQQLLAFLDSDDMAATDWLETVYSVFQKYKPDALLHKYFPCSTGIPEPKDMLGVPSPENIVVANELFPQELIEADIMDAFRWVCCPKHVTNSTSAFDREFNHPWWVLGHISVQRNAYLSVRQREGPFGRKKEDAMFVADLLRQNYTVLAIENYLTGYCKF